MLQLKQEYQERPQAASVESPTVIDKLKGSYEVSVEQVVEPEQMHVPVIESEELPLDIS